MNNRQIQLDRLKDALVKVLELYGLDIIKIDKCSGNYSFTIDYVYGEKNHMYDIIYDIMGYEIDISYYSDVGVDLYKISFYRKNDPFTSSFRYFPRKDENEYDFVLQIFKDLNVLTKDEMIIKDIIE